MKSLEEIIVLAANTEKTPELVDFWLSRYREVFIKDGDFLLHENTVKAVSSPSLSAPITPIGEVDILKYFNENTKSFDVATLQDIIFIVVRFLDSILDIIPFDKEALKKVQEFRKIGIGVKNLSEFEDRFFQKSGGEKILDDLGAILSNFSYRASEALADEKGCCTNWVSIKYKILNKSFTRWITDNNDIFDGEYIFKNYTQDSVERANVQQIPRRNSHLILLNNNPIWLKWSDRNISLETLEIEKKDLKNTPNLGLNIFKENNGTLKLFRKRNSKNQIIELKDGQILESWTDTDLKPLSDIEILNYLNKSLNIQVNLYIFNGANIAVDNNGKVPSFNLGENTSLYSGSVKTLSNIFNSFIDILQIKIHTILPQKDGAIIGCQVQLNKEIKLPFKLPIKDILNSELESKLVKPILNDIQKHSKTEEKINNLENTLRELEKEREVNQIIIQNAQKWDEFEEVTFGKKILLSNGSKFKVRQTVFKQRLINIQFENDSTENLDTLMIFTKMLEINLNNQLKDIKEDTKHEKQFKINLQTFKDIAGNNQNILEFLDKLDKILVTKII